MAKEETWLVSMYYGSGGVHYRDRKVTATSQKMAAKKLGVSLWYFRQNSVRADKRTNDPNLSIWLK